MDILNKYINQLVQKTLEMEDKSVKTLHQEGIYFHSQMHETNINAVDYSEEILDSSQQQQEKSQEFSQQNPADKNVNRHTTRRIKYPRIKSRNFLSNISDTDIKKNDFYNKNFILDIYVLLVKNLNRFSLSRKVTGKTKHEMVYKLWRECIPSKFYRHICEEKNFIYLNGQDVGHPGVLQIVGGFINQGKENVRMLQQYLAQYNDIFQYICSHIFPEIYTIPEKRDVDLKSNFHILFKSYCDKMLMQQQLIAKNPSNQNQKENVQIQSNAIAKSNDLLNDAKKSENKKDRN